MSDTSKAISLLKYNISKKCNTITDTRTDLKTIYNTLVDITADLNKRIGTFDSGREDDGAQ